MLRAALLLVVLLAGAAFAPDPIYQANWASLDARPLPQWCAQATLICASLPKSL